MNAQSSDKPRQSPASDARFTMLERPNDDFPFYNDEPAKISGLQWCFVMVMVVIGYGMLFVPLPFFTTRAGQFIPRILFFVIPLIGLSLVASKHWTAIFRAIRGMDIVWMIVFGVCNFLTLMIVGMILKNALGATTNETIAGRTKTRSGSHRTTLGRFHPDTA